MTLPSKGWIERQIKFLLEQKQDPVFPNGHHAAGKTFSGNIEVKSGKKIYKARIEKSKKCRSDSSSEKLE